MLLFTCCLSLEALSKRFLSHVYLKLLLLLTVYYKVLPVLVQSVLWQQLELRFAVANWTTLVATFAVGEVW